MLRVKRRAADASILAGLTVIVTGANSGIGLHAARQFARSGARVVLACRNVRAAESVAVSIGNEARVEDLDLASLASIRAFVRRWDGPLDLLVNNAGVMAPPTRRETRDGFELQYGTNHLGHVALTAGLLPTLLEADRPRVVTVSSLAHHAGDASILEAANPPTYRPRRGYRNSKLGNLFFARELHRRARQAGSSLASVACHPGLSSTGIVSSRDGMGAQAMFRVPARLLMPAISQSSTSGAAAIVDAATTADSGSYRGPQLLRETRGPIGEAKLSSEARDTDLQRRAIDLALNQTASSLTF